MSEKPKKQRLNPFGAITNQVKKGINKGSSVTSKTVQKIPVAGKRIIADEKDKLDEKSPEQIRQEELKSKGWFGLIATSEMIFHLPIFLLVIAAFGVLTYHQEPDWILILAFGFTCGYSVLGILAFSDKIFQEYLTGITVADLV